MDDTDPEKTVVGRFEPVVVTGPSGTVRVKAKVDTAADRSNVGERVLDRVGRSDDGGEVTTRAGDDSDRRETYPVTVELLGVDDGRRSVEPNVKDRSEYTGNFLVGRDLLTELDLVVDPSVDNWNGTDDIEG